MSQMPAEMPVELEVDYELDGNVLVVIVEYGNAKARVTLDWADETADPGSDFNFLHAVLPTAVARVHQQINEGGSSAGDQNDK